MWNCFNGSSDTVLPSEFTPLITDGEVQHMHGVIYSLEHAVAQEKVVVLRGSTLLQQYDTHLKSGNLTHQDSLPSGLVELTGRTLSTLDNAAYAKRQSALLDAFSTLQVTKYQSAIDAIVQSKHGAWAARGGSFSIANEAKKLVFHVFVGVVLGLDDQYDELFAIVNQYRELLPKNLCRPHAKAITLRKDLINKLIAPAVTAGRSRVLNKQTKDCVVDYLIQQSELTDADITTELFQALIDGTDGISSLIINCVNAWVNQPGMSDKLASVRDAPDDFVNQFIDEVERVYTAGPSHEYARVVKRTTFTTPKSSFTITKGQLVVALTESINEDPTLWPNPTLFDPSRFQNGTPDPYKFTAFSLLQLVNRPQGVREAFTKAVLRSNMLSLLNCMWQMVPLQSYELSEHTVSNPTPVGQLMVVGFHKRHAGSANCVTTAGNPADWTFLEQPEAKEYRQSVESLGEAFEDCRLDFWTHAMIQAVKNRSVVWRQPTAQVEITVPKYQKVLEKVTLSGTNIEVPVEDEDTGNDLNFAQAHTFNLLRDLAPLVDNLDATWLPGEDMEGYVMSKVGMMWPRVNVHWNDRYSDRALELLAFNGVGQHLLSKLPEAHDDGSYYTIALEFMYGLAVREGFANYGGDAFFTQEGQVVKIIYGGATYLPDSEQWEYAKMAFRGSLLARVTALDHLLGTHVTVANYLTTASREQLPPEHPLRRLIKPFTFRSVAINYSAASVLFWPKGMVDRAFAFTHESLESVWAYGLKHFSYEPFPEFVANQQIDTVELPFHQDGMDYWTICHNFVSKYVDLYYSDDEQLASDAAVASFWQYLVEKVPVPEFPTLSLDNLKNFLAHCIFLVSAVHNHVGSIAEYVSDPAFCPSAWVKGELAGRPPTSVRAALIMAAAGLPQPSILEDFSHVMLDDNAKTLCQEFTAALVKHQNVVDARNTKRAQPFQSFNPKMMEIAVSI